MSGLVSYFRNKIEANMEPASVRDARWEERLRGVKEASEAVKKNMAHPTKNWGFWKSDRQTAKFEELRSVDLSQPDRQKPM